LGCALGSRKRQQICRSSGGSSIGSCGISCCGGGGSMGAAATGYTLTVGAAGRGMVGAGGVLRLRPCSLHYALAARATPSRLGFHPRGSRYALATRALPSRLGFALAAHAMRSRLGLQRRRRWRRRQWKQRRQMLALAACATQSRLGLRPRGSALPASPSRLALHARGTANVAEWLDDTLSN
jgi:hypothetical protein